MGKSIALSPARGGRATGQSGLAQDPENGYRIECRGQRKEEEEQIPQDHVLASPGHHPLPLVLALKDTFFRSKYFKKNLTFINQIDKM